MMNFRICVHQMQLKKKDKVLEYMKNVETGEPYSCTTVPLVDIVANIQVKAGMSIYTDREYEWSDLKNTI